MTPTIIKTMKTPTLSGCFAAKFVAMLIAILLISGAQALYAQKLGKGFKLLANKEYDKAMSFFKDAKDKKIEQFAVNYALSRIFGDAESPYFKADQAMMYIKQAQKFQKTENISEEFIKGNYNFDFQDVDVQYNYALYAIINNINDIETITKLFRMGLNGDYERGILEEKAFKCALIENSTISYSRFLEFYKDSKYANQAKENYIKKWFEKADEYILTTKHENGFNKFKLYFPESRISKNCNTPDDYKLIRSKAIVSPDYQLAPELNAIIDISDSLQLNKDEIMQYFIVNYCLQENQPKPEAPKKTEPKIKQFVIRETEIPVGAKLLTRLAPTQRIRPKSTPSGKDFVLETYGDNPYAIKDFNRGRRAIAYYYMTYFDTDIDWEYFADTLEKIDFDDERFKAAIARLQEDYPRAFYPDQSNSVGNNVFTRICGAEIKNNHGIYSPIFQQFENRKISGTNLTFQTSDHYSTYRHPRSGRYYYYFIATTPDSLVCGAYMLAPEIDSNDVTIGHKIMNIKAENGSFKVLKSNCPGLVFFERKWSQLYYLVEEKKGDSSRWLVRKKYKREYFE
jgi:hypothetical protein